MIRKNLLLLSIFSGFLLSLPWITTSFSWTLFFAFVPLLIVENQIAEHKQSKGSVVLFLHAFITFLVWNVLSTWWIAYVSFSGMMIITIVNSILMASVWWLMHLVHRRFTAQTGYFSLIVFWLTFEYLHFHWSIQWPWIILGNGFSNSVKLIQWFEYTGALGGSLWILLTNILLFSAYKSFLESRYSKLFQLLVWILLLIAIPISWSLYRYYTYSEDEKTVEIVVLQPNVNPYTEKFSGMSAEEQTHRLISLARTMVTDSTDYVLAPETALATMWENERIKENQVILPIDSFINDYPYIRFVAGAITQKELGSGELYSYTTRRTEDGHSFDVFNSTLLFDQSKKVQIGHKSVLVSGVEKMPFQKYFSFLGKYVVSVGGTSGSLSAANQPTVFEGSNQDRIGSVICFESAFGEFVGSAVRNGANVLFIITNDGWWKDSYGITQHFGFSRIRAIETRRSIARSANTGISGFINGRGDIIKKTSVNSCVAISASLFLNNAITFYVRFGDYLGWLSLLSSCLILIYLLIGNIRNKT